MTGTKKPARKRVFSLMALRDAQRHASDKQLKVSALDGSTETLVEALDAATGGSLLLLAGVERVALGAHVQREGLLGSGTDFVLRAAGAGCGLALVVRMDTLFHGV
jgi:hypothetical protein